MLRDFFNVFDTGLTRIFGGRGTIERVMDNIFWESVLPVFNRWLLYAANGDDTEKALLRYTLSHLIEFIDVDSDAYYPEEMYVVSAGQDGIKTGNIIQNKSTSVFFIVLSPACDLVVRKNGDFKTDRILVAQIEKRNNEL